MLRALASTVLPLKRIKTSMIFPEKISSIKASDRVLEIGPGATPHPRSDAFLELKFHESKDKIAQRGGVNVDPNFGTKPVFFYDGEVFPFDDNQFDYVICSHVIEHVPNPEYFLNELFRVSGGRGYIEYPLITYEYLYNFDVHSLFIKYDQENDTLSFLPKTETAIADFLPVSDLLRKLLELGWNDLLWVNRDLFFEGFEFDRPFSIKKAKNISSLVSEKLKIRKKHLFRKITSSFWNKVGF